MARWEDLVLDVDGKPTTEAHHRCIHRTHRPSLPLVLVIRPCARDSGETDNPCRRRLRLGHCYAGGEVHFRRRDEAIALIVVIWK